MTLAIVRIVDFCARCKWIVIAFGTLLLLGAVVFDAARFSIDTDIEGLISQNLPWHERQLELNKAFPQEAITAVVQAPTAENTEMAADELAQSLAKDQNQFRTVGQPDSGDFFERNELLFAAPSEIKKSVAGLADAQRLCQELPNDRRLAAHGRRSTASNSPATREACAGHRSIPWLAPAMEQTRSSSLASSAAVPL
jgi:uncharacterized protein